MFAFGPRIRWTSPVFPSIDVLFWGQPDAEGSVMPIIASPRYAGTQGVFRPSFRACPVAIHTHRIAGAATLPSDARHGAMTPPAIPLHMAGWVTTASAGVFPCLAS